MRSTAKRQCAFLLAVVMVLSLMGLAVPTGVRAETVAEEPDLRAGIISDVHLAYAWDTEQQSPRLKKAMQFYAQKGIDILIIAGDVQDPGYATEEDPVENKMARIDEMAQYFNECFAGTDTKLLFIYGNHDYTLVDAQYHPATLEGSYSDAFTMEVNGYQFVAVHDGKESLGSVDTMLAQAVEATPDKPVFYIQHSPILNTVRGSRDSGDGNSQLQSGYHYSVAGWDNIRSYSNVVAFTGHTHAPLTDEQSIWQDGTPNGGGSTVINTATLNYAGVLSDHFALNGSEPGKTNEDTQHGLYMTVTGSQVNVERYSLRDLEENAETVTLSNAVKVGADWSFNVSDPDDRPYAPETRYANAYAPVFSSTELTVTAADTSVTATVPAATVQAPEGFSDMVQYYRVDAVDAQTGEVAASGYQATAYHVDQTPDTAQSYTITVNGLETGKTYIINAYAVEFFGKASLPLSATVQTTGDAVITIRQGDVDGNGTVDQEDLALLEKIHTGEAADTAYSDVDGNRVKEALDISALQDILNGLPMHGTQPAEENDLLGGDISVQMANLSGGPKQGEELGGQVQSAVVRGDSTRAVKIWTSKALGWCFGEVYFEEAQDWSSASTLSFDVLWENEFGNIIGDADEQSASWRNVSIQLLYGAMLHRSNGVGVKIDPQETGWSTVQVPLCQVSNVDFTNIRGFRFLYNFEAYTLEDGDERFDGTAQHTMYIDNVQQSGEAAGTDTDLLHNAMISGGNMTVAADKTAGSYQAVSTDGAMQITFAEPIKMNSRTELSADIRLIGADSVTVQLLGSDGNTLGTAVTPSAYNRWTEIAISSQDFNLTDTQMVSGIAVTVSGGTVYLDNIIRASLPDADMLAVSDGSGVGFTLDKACTDSYGNDSNTAWKVTYAGVEGTAYPTFWITLDQGYDLTNKNLVMDVKFEGASQALRVEKLENSSKGSLVVGRSANFSYVELGDGWYRATLDCSALTLNEGMNLTDVKVIALGLTTNGFNNNVYLDNMKIVDDPATVESGKDLLYTASGTGAGFTLDKANTDVCGENSALSWKVTYGGAEGTKYPTFWITLDQGYDLTNKNVVVDVKFEGASQALRVEKMENSSNESLVVGRSANFSYVELGDGWYRATLNSSALTLNDGMNLTDVKMIALGLTTNGFDNAVYLDNMRIVDDVATIEKATDLLYTASGTGAGFTLDKANTDVCGENSALSWKVTYGGAEGTKYPTFWITLDQGYDLTNKNVVVDVKFEGASQALRVEKMENSSNESLVVGRSANFSYVELGDGWYRATLNSSALTLNDGMNLTDVKMIALGLTTNGFDNAVYLDNMRIVDDVATIEKATDLLYTASGTGAGFTLDKANTDVCGENSAVSWKVTYGGSEGATLYPVYWITLEQAWDLTMQNIVLDVKFEGAQQYLDIFALQGSDSSDLVVARSETATYEELGNGWYRATFDIAGVELKEGKNLTDVKAIAFGLTTVGTNNVITMDNLHFETNRTAGEKASDLLYTADCTCNGFTLDKASTDVYGENSIAAWVLTRANQTSATAYPTFWITLDQSYDLTNKNIVMEVKTQTMSQFLRAYQIQDSAGQNLITANKASANAVWEELGDGWYRIVIDCDKLPMLEGKDLTDVMKLNFIIETKQGDNVLWMDNLRIEDK